MSGLSIKKNTGFTAQCGEYRGHGDTERSALLNLANSLMVDSHRESAYALGEVISTLFDQNVALAAEAVSRDVSDQFAEPPMIEVRGCGHTDDGEYQEVPIPEASFFGVYRQTIGGLLMHDRDFPTVRQAQEYIDALRAGDVR